jgi:hypothetical protein
MFRVIDWICHRICGNPYKRKIVLYILKGGRAPAEKDCVELRSLSELGEIINTANYSTQIG